MLRYIENNREENASNLSLKRMSDMVGKTRGETAARIQEKFALSEEETAHYMDTFWTE